jgi:hypothetical protein
VLEPGTQQPGTSPGEAAEQAAEPGAARTRAGFTPGKGKPTPKRSEAERRRRQPYAAPADRKAAARQSRAKERAARARRMEAMRRGEEWALPRKDQGPVRRLARDYVDSRRSLSEYYIFGIVVLVVLLFLPSLRQSLVVDYVLLLMLAVIVVEGVYVGRKVVTLAQQRYPGESTRGLRMYAAVRNTQFRRLRMPPPRVSRGDRV